MKLIIQNQNRPGFTLIITISLLVLITLIGVGILSLSAVTLRSSSRQDDMMEARSNARMALMIAIGELQKEMGPDMRVSAEAAIFDQNAKTEKIEGVSQPHWLASYESWGGWLNDSYTNPSSGSTLKIQDTYTPKREPMFRKWLLSMPQGMTENVNAPNSLSGWDDSNSVILVGEGSLGETAQSSPEKITRAYLNKVGDTGRQAWWISPENHKARIDKAKKPRALSAAAWEVAQSATTEVGVGVIPGLDPLDANTSLSNKLITRPSLSPAGIDDEIVQKHFFDLTASSRGVLASVRTGHLKKDLSLLFEKGKSSLPAPYLYSPGDVREPSIRPMSSDLKANNPKLPERHFASWTRMRHFYRMYRQDSDAEARTFPGGTEGTPGMNWTGSKPWVDSNVSTYSSSWDGQDTYVHFPILSHITYILSLKTERLTSGANAGKFDLRYVASPVCVYWNPYNVELRVPDKKLAMRSYLAQVHTMDGLLSLNNTYTKTDALRFDDDYARMMSGSSQDIIFKPGEFRIFSPVGSSLVTGNKLDMMPGFDPQSYGGLYSAVGAYTQAQNPKYQMRFSNRINSWKFNFREGNTPASFVFMQYWSPIGDNNGGNYTIMGYNLHVDWFNTSQLFTPISAPTPWVFDGQILPVGYFQFALKGLHDHDYDTINWERDWRCRNWVQAPPFYLGQGLYMSDDATIGNTQRMDAAYEMRFGSLLGSGKSVEDIIQHVGQSAIMGKEEIITAAPSLELPTAPIGSLAGFGSMRIHPGWVDFAVLNPDWKRGAAPAPNNNASGNSLYRAESKVWAYQSGVTGPGIGNSFLHPMIPRTGVYKFFNNSISMDMIDIVNADAGYTPTDTKAYSDYWDHVLLLNDALWDDYFVSSLADQTRPGATASASLNENIDKLVSGKELANARYLPYLGGRTADEVKSQLDAKDGYLKAAAHLMVDGMFNVNSTSVDAWHALFAGIRERQVVYRDGSGTLKPVTIPSGKRIALSRFNTANSDKEGNDPLYGVSRDDGMQAWSGVRFIDDTQLRKLAEECVIQVKQRGPFLNFSEFINRRLSNDSLGIMGALQSAIDYDDASPDSRSINYDFKSDRDFMLQASDLGTNAYSTPEAAVGSRFAGIPGYVIQSDLLQPIANTLSVRDDTFRIRAYGDKIDANGKTLARAWCEAVVQRLPEYSDSTNSPEIPTREMTQQGGFTSIDNSALTPINRRFGRKFQIESFRWLSSSEI
jgi:hypothetical protein